MRELLSRVIPAGSEVELHSDSHPAYPRALGQLPGRRVKHRQTSSRELRTPRNPLFPVNLADLLIRHCGANHKRETIAFSKRRQGALYSLAVWQVWRNYMKHISEQRGGPTPARKLGVLRRRIRLREVLARRLLTSHVSPQGWLERCYFGRIPTRRIPNCVEHRRTYAV